MSARIFTRAFRRTYARLHGDDTSGGQISSHTQVAEQGIRVRVVVDLAQNRDSNGLEKSLAMQTFGMIISHFRLRKQRTLEIALRLTIV